MGWIWDTFLKKTISQETNGMLYNSYFLKFYIPSWYYKAISLLPQNVEGFKVRLVVQGYSQKKGIDYKETFSAVYSKDSLRIIKALIVHFDLELH